MTTTSSNDIHRTIQLLKHKLVASEASIERTRSSITITTAQLKQLLRVIAPEPDTSVTLQPSSIEVSLRVAELDKRVAELDKRVAELDKRVAELDKRGNEPDESGWIADTSAKSGFRKITSPVSGPAKTNSPDEPKLTKGWTIIKNASSYKVKEDMLGQSRYVMTLPKMKEWCLESYRQVGGFNSPIYNDDDNSNEYFPRCRTPDELINEATHYVERVWLTPERYPLPDTSMIYIAPGATMELLRTKEKGFEIVYDPIDQ